MRIVKKSDDRRAQWRAFWLLLAVAAFAAGILLGQAGAIGAVRESYQNLLSRWPGLRSTSLPVVTVDLAFADYNNLLGQRETALQEGVLFPRDSALVPADIQLENGTIPVQVRLLPGIAKHLGTDEKWNYEVLVRNDALLAGATQANLIDPADNNGPNEWAFLEAVRREDLQTGDYQFVDLILNGDVKGTYALQETLGPVIDRDGQGTPSVLVGYDVEPLLDSVSYFGDVGSAIADPVTNIATNDLRFLPIADIRDPLITDDPVLAQQAQRASSLLRGLQSGELSASQVFDAQKYGRFLALADLWGAAGILSPFNLRYAYNSETDKLEPVPINAAVVQPDYRVPPEAMYGDAAIQEAYASAAARLSDPVYLTELRAAIETDYRNLAALQDVGYDDEELWQALAERQAQLRRSLQPAQPMIAQLGSPALAQDAIIQINVASTINLPQEILGFDIDGATFMESNPAWIADGESYVDIDGERMILKPVAGDSAGGLRFVTFNIPVTEILARDRELDFLNEIQVQVASRVLGIEEAQMTPASPGLLENQ